MLHLLNPPQCAVPRADPLGRYHAKRNFSQTKEPVGVIGKSGGNRFIVQKHDASSLHWDFRLEIDGVLKSWAVTRAPSPNRYDKRLAVRTEDYPLSYADFEGTIPKGEYGGGTVMLWDTGSWVPIAGKHASDLDGGHLLLLAINERGALRYAGKVGAGFDDALLRSIRAKLDQLAINEAVVNVPRPATRNAHWVKPQLVAEVAFAEFTADQILLHASFIGLRDNKPATSVLVQKPLPPPSDDDRVKISNPHRVIFPGDAITKADLASYYRAIGTIMLPIASRRPVSVVRCPQGRAKACFFQKYDAGSFGETVQKVLIGAKYGTREEYLWIDSVAGLVACVQKGTIKFHGWGSRNDHIERPDRMIFDLDADEAVTFDTVKKAAADLNIHLADLGLVSFAMLSGGKGIHVLVALRPKAKWPVVKDFADRFSQALATAEPDRFVATMSKSKRKGRIFIDWLCNQRGSTAMLPYSVRSRAGAPVAARVTWDELRDIKAANAFTVRDAADLVRRATSLNLTGWGVADQTLPDH